MKYQIAVYQQDADASGNIVENTLAKKTLSQNHVETNLAFVKEHCSKSKSDGRVYGIVTEVSDERLPRAWKIDPYESTQTDCGVEVIDPKTGQRRYEGDEGPEDFD